MPKAKRLSEICAEKGIELREFPDGHYQIHGALVVDYWPFSKRKTAYIGETKRTYRYCAPMDAVNLAGGPKPSRGDLDDLSKRTPEQWAQVVPKAKFAWKKEN